MQGATGAKAAGVTGMGVGSGVWIGREGYAEKTDRGSDLNPLPSPWFIGTTNFIFLVFVLTFGQRNSVSFFSALAPFSLPDSRLP